MIGTVILYLLAAIGAVALLSAVGVWLFVWRLPEAELDDAAPVDVVTGNVRVIRDAHLAVCDCHDSWDQCPCTESGHDTDCGCCGGGICGPLPAATGGPLRTYGDGTPERFVPLSDEGSVRVDWPAWVAVVGLVVVLAAAGFAS